jgi:hypothetical protein
VRILAGLVAFLAVAAVALANTGSKTDPSGDVKHNPPGKDARYDVVKISYGHGGGRLVNTVKTKGKIATKPPPLLWIDVPGKVATRGGCQYSDYFVAGNEVDECGDGPKTGSATIKKLDDHRMRFTFDAAAIGSPSRYGIAFVNEGSAHGKLIFYDRAPDKGFLKHQLK